MGCERMGRKAARDLGADQAGAIESQLPHARMASCLDERRRKKDRRVPSGR